ncbi:glutathione peroxidase [bacterium]|nr:glutathione peroxidase [bacterium]
MKTISIILIICIGLVLATKIYATLTKKKIVTNTITTQNETKTITQLHDLSYTTLLGDTIPLSTYKGTVLLIVNTASRCGFTSQYKDLQKLYEMFQDKNFEIIGFPCNQFGNQEPGTNKEIKQFCDIRYKTTFPMSEKIDVAGEKQNPIYKFLTSPKTNPNFGGPINWNFNKFLIDQQGNVIARFSSLEKPNSRKIKKLINKTLSKTPNETE